MIRYALRRVLSVIPIALIAVTICFFILRLAPGGPFDTERQLLPEIEANLRAAYHLDEPLYQQFGRYLFGLLRFDFGPSFQYRDRSVNDIIAQGFPITLTYGTIAFVLEGEQGSRMMVGPEIGEEALEFAGVERGQLGRRHVTAPSA